MAYSSRIHQKTLEQLSPNRKKQIEIASVLEDLVMNSKGWGYYEKWLENQYTIALNALKTCNAEELVKYQATVNLIESLKGWMVTTIEKGKKLRTTLLSETTEEGK